ncbi:hypothetical protein EDS67_20745 [candidate division KSB1 bacterium]|nr:MAG: hypothetical protein EDS67_20745 [candidate division KSB1 bacterium]MBC6949895.1 hypothetical protein [candidate division KSB1 bacterium]MCE7943811.1 hypothetical protein [Chlorobi bacterium CHB1]
MSLKDELRFQKRHAIRKKFSLNLFSNRRGGARKLIFNFDQREQKYTPVGFDRQPLPLRRNSPMLFLHPPKMT